MYKYLYKNLLDNVTMIITAGSEEGSRIILARIALDTSEWEFSIKLS